MPRRLKAACSIASTLSAKPHHQHIWVSDELLAHTFRSFAHRHCRYGSNVPGPLEARRRASKRRNTSLSYGDSGGFANEPAIFLGTGSQAGWWGKSEESTATLDQRSVLAKDTERDSTGSTFVPFNKQEQRSWLDESGPSLLPLWLLKPLQRSPPIRIRDEVRDAGPAYREQAVSQERKTVQLQETFRERLQACNSTKSMHRLLGKLNVNVRQSPEIAELAFQHALEIFHSDPSQYALIEDFLVDFTLNPPGSRNHIGLVQNLCKRSVEQSMWELHLLPAMCDAIRLGLVDVEQVQQIVLLIPRLYEICKFNSDRGDTLVQYWHQFLNAVESSEVLSIQDLGTPFVSSWYQCVSNLEHDDMTIDLMYRLREYAPASEIDTVVELTLSKLGHIRDEYDPNIWRVADWIKDLSIDLRASVVLKTSQNLVLRAMKNDATQRTMPFWRMILSGLMDDTAAPFDIEIRTWNEAMTSPYSFSPAQNLLVLAWTAVNLFSRFKDAPTRLFNLDFQHHLNTVLGATTDPEVRDLLVRLLLTLDTLSYSQKKDIFKHLKFLSDGRLISALTERNLLSDISTLTTHTDFGKLVDEDLHRAMKRNYQADLTRLAETINSDLPSFERLSQSLILKNQIYYRVVHRIIMNNTAIKLALPCWTNTRYQSRISSDGGQLNPAQVVSLINNLAVYFAVSPVVSPRSAFRNTYRLYLYLHRYGGPIQPLMSRALWHAGVTRYGRAGMAKTQLRWCYNKVREIEGIYAANMLLWSAGYRRERNVEIEKLGLSNRDATDVHLPRDLHNLKGKTEVKSDDDIYDPYDMKRDIKGEVGEEEIKGLNDLRREESGFD